MIKLDRKEECCGCSACLSVCPQSCITMREDEEGFLYPYVNEQACINCNLCNCTCPVINSLNEYKDTTDTYVAYCKDEDLRLSSSSGGIFSLLAEEVLNREGVVFGAAFDNDMLVHHIGITKSCELARLRGSKYLQSRMEATYADTEKALKNQKAVLFSGTACQIAGLKKYLKKEYDNLYSIDVLCHGTPSPKLWKKYLAWREQKAGAFVKDISFRNKEKGWKSYSLKITFKNNKEYKEPFYTDPYMQLFLSDICLRPSCHDCRFKGVNRPSDITLGDCWGIENYMPEMDDNKGVSVVLLHTDKGRRLLDLADTRLCKNSAELKCALSPDSDSRRSVEMHPKRAEFFTKLDIETMEGLIRFIMPSYRTRVLTAFNKTKHKLQYRLFRSS